MIAGCIDRMRQDACGDCARRDACSFLFADLLGFAARTERRPVRRREQASAPRQKHPFLAFLGGIAQAVERSAARRATPVREEVERRLEPLLASGEIRVAAMARRLGMSRQTLYRRLKAEGATFEEILDGLRRRLAVRLVREQRLPVKEAAYRLGFSDPAAFSRAFKRWTGLSPQAFRDQPG